jgi:8-hydroxy-5-deazaflavin:NADPH oxidoreductase
MKIGIIGSGNVGKMLALGFEKYHHTVMISSRTPEKLLEWKKSASFKGNTGTFHEAAGFGELLVLAVGGIIAAKVLKSIGPEMLKGKIIIDPTNPIANEPPVNGVIKFFTRLDKSLMEQLQHEYPETRFVKAFSCIGAAHMVNPDFGGTKPTMFICGNDAAAKKEVTSILTQFGFETQDMGSVEAARAIEPLCILWCIPGLTSNEWNHAFKWLKK